MKFRFKKAEIGKYKNIDPVHCIDKLSHGCRILGLTRGQFSLIDLIFAILEKVGPSHVICTTWSAGIKDAHQVRWMVDTNLIKSFKLITDHSYSTRQSKYALSLEELFGKENIRTSEIHAKFTLIHNESFKICIRTSMNLNANKTCENFEIDEDLEIFNFYMDFVEHHFGHMPKGFEESSRVVNKNLDKYFGKAQEFDFLKISKGTGLSMEKVIELMSQKGKFYNKYKHIIK